MVIGAGAVGQIIAAHLHKAGFELELIDKRHWAHFDEHGIRIRGLKKMDVPDVTAQQSLDLSNISNPSVVFVAVKTPFLEVVLDELKRLPPSVPIVLAENGLDAERLAVASLPLRPVNQTPSGSQEA